MRIRTVKPEFFLHDRLFDAEQEFGLPLRISFIGIWCACDREGRFKWEPRRLGVSILPYDNVEFSRVLDALATRGFIVKYRVNNEDYGLVPSFKHHQIINNRESESTLPDSEGFTLEIDASTTREPRVNHASKAEGKGMEGNGKEGVANGTRPTARKKEDPSEWLEALKISEAYRGIDVLREFHKMVNWCETKRKEPTRARFVNWLNRIEVPLFQIKPLAKKSDFIGG